MDEYLSRLKEILTSYSLDSLFGDNVVHFSNIKSFDGLPSIVISSANLAINDFILSQLLSNLFNVPISSINKKEEVNDEISISAVKVGYTYYKNKYYFEYPLNETRGNDKVVFSKFVTNIITTKCIIPGAKHVVKIVITERISEILLQALKNLIEKYSCSTLFIFSTTSQNTLDNKVLNQCMVLRCNIDMNRFLHFVIPDLSDDSKEIVMHKSGNDPIKALILLKTSILGSHLESWLHKQIHHLIQIKGKSYVALFEEIHDISLKLVTTCVLFKDICKALISVVAKVAPSKVVDFVAICSDIQHKSTQVNKVVFCYDDLFLKCISLMDNG